MKEMLEKISNSFKTGVMIWILAYLLLYLIGAYTNDFSVYNAEVTKLTDAKNFLAQVVIAGSTYVILEVVLVYFVNKMFKASENEKGKFKEIVKSFVTSLLILVLLIGTLYIIKENDIVNKNTIKLMMVIIAIKAIIFSVSQVINNCVYNKKLKEKKQ